MLVNHTSGPKLQEALGKILDQKQDLAIYEEEVLKSGVRVGRAYQYARWIDGSP